MRPYSAAHAAGAALLALVGVAQASPQFTIIDMGVMPGDSFSQGLRVSPGGIGVGRSIPGSGGAHAFTWSVGGGQVGLPSLTNPIRNFSVANSANDSGTVVGTGATTLSGSGRLPLIWQNGVVSQLALPSGQTLGDANDVNASNVVVGSAGSGSSQRGVVYQNGSSSIITTTTATGCFVTTFFGVSNSGLAVGSGIDPNNAARNVGYVYNLTNNTAFEVGALPGRNGALCFDISNAGHIVGATMQNQGASVPFLWTEAGGMVAIPLVAGASNGSARGVNSNGWVVGTAGGATALPFLYDGVASYRLGDLIAPGSGWDLTGNTSSSALGISEDGMIVGAGVLNGVVHGYAMVLVPTPGAAGLMALGALTIAARRRR